MGKKLLTLFLVLAWASLVSADVYWQGDIVVPPGSPPDWENPANWGGTLPTLSDYVRLYRFDGSPASVQVSSVGVAKAGKLSTNSGGVGQVYLLINTGADLQNDGSYESYINPSLVDVYGTWNACTSTLQTGTFKLGGNGQSNTVVVYGSLYVKSNNSTFTTALSMGYTGGAGGGLVKVMDSGYLYADSIVFTGTTNDIKLYGTGKVEVKGNVTGTLPLSTRFFGDDTVGNVQATYNSGTNLTTIVVPEPATVTLLGAGSLMLLRRKR